MNSIELEERRLLALRRYGLLDSAPEAIFDGITVAIANICEVPIALISLVDEERQWFKSSFGLKVKETPRDIAFCNHAIQRPDELMLVEDASTDPRFVDNPLVTADPNIRFYAGKPIMTGDGYPLGTLCAIDREPRQLKQYQIEALTALASTVSAIFEERHRLQKTVIDRDSMEEVLIGQVDRYQHLYEDSSTLLQGLLEERATASAVINEKGSIVSTNNAWDSFSSLIGWNSLTSDSNYFVACDAESAPFGKVSDDALSGIHEVLSGQAKSFKINYTTAIGICRMEIHAISEPARGAMVQHYFSSVN